ncbi:MAG: NBR1-Ig-like domain-containing protein [Chloroflexota bacterium]
MLQRRVLSAAAASLMVTALTACNIGRSPEPTADVSALYTAAAETLIAQFGEQQTQTAQAVTPTPQASPTPLASSSPLPTFPLGAGLTPFGTLSAGSTPLSTPAGPLAQSFPVGCDDAQFYGESIPDKTVMVPQHTFKKTWSLQNVGTCTWDEGYSFAFKSGDKLSAQPLVVNIITEKQFTKPGHSQAFAIQMEAPKEKGEFIGFWQMRSDDGTWFGSLVSVYIIVQ